MADVCPANRDAIASLTKGLEQSTPNAEALQRLFISAAGDVLPKGQRQACLNDIAAQNRADVLASAPSTPLSEQNMTVPEKLAALSHMKAQDILPTVQISDDKLMVHRSNLTTDERSPNGVWKTVYALTQENGKPVMQFGDQKISLK